MNMADTIKKCRWCGTHPCPYPKDEEFAQQIEEHGKEWLRNMPCWTPIEEFSVVSRYHVYDRGVTLGLSGVNPVHKHVVAQHCRGEWPRPPAN